MANIQEAIEYAKKNPTSSFANELKRRIESGQMNSELQSAGLTQYLTPEEPSLGSKLTERAKTFGKEALSISTLGASTLSPQDVQEAKTNPEQRPLVALQAFNRAFQSPAKAAMAVGGAIGDVVGAGIEKTGLDKIIAENVAPVLSPVVKSEGAKRLSEKFNSLDPEIQNYLKGVPEIANVIGLEVVPGAIAKQIGKMSVKNSALDTIKGSSGNLTQKALDFISADPEKKVETILKESTPSQLDNYLGIAEKAAADPRIATPFEVVGNKLSDTTKLLENKLKDIGARKSAVIEPMREGLGSFKSETTPLIQKLTSLKNSFTEIDRGSRAKVQAIINDAKTISTKRGADAFIDKVQNALYVGNADMTIPRGSALDKQLKGIIGEYNTSLKNSLPEEYAALNKQYSELIDSLDVINRSLGEVVEGVPVRGASLIKQFFSPSGTKAKEIFDFVKKETNGEIDLAKDATLAKFSMDLFDDPRSRSLLAGIGDIPTSVGGVVTKVAEKLGGDKLQEAMRSSTIRKAKEISLPKSAKESYSSPKEGVKSESQSSANTTPTSTKGKGIRGMYNIDELIKAFTPADKAEFKSLQETLSKAERMGITGYDKLGGATEKNFVGEYPAKVRSAAINLIHLVEDYPNKTEVFNSMDDNIMNVIKDSGYDINYLKKGVSSKIQPDTKGYILLDGKPQEVPAKKVDLGGGVDFFAHESKNGTVTITEKNSGMSIGSGQSLQEAIDNSKYVIKEKAGGISKLKELLKTKENKEIINSYSNNPSELVPKKKVVSSPTKVYHGTTEAKPGVSSGGNLGNGTYYFKDKKMASEWGGSVYELDFPINPKVYKNRSSYESDLNALIKSETGKNSTKEISDTQLVKYQKLLNEKLQNSGYDGIDLPDGGILFKK